MIAWSTILFFIDNILLTLFIVAWLFPLGASNTKRLVTLLGGKSAIIRLTLSAVK